MFGESDSESPRAPSPWDSLTPPTHDGIPKLVPEAEQGNIEYKLQLLSPTPARFTRLVTQLKWRLLEGGGQAYYELGVADSGTLVGLPRQQLEQSLETLEMMAGEIGASVIVVKEIEVPPELSSLAESELAKWEGKRSATRKDLLRMTNHEDSPTTSATEVETDVSATDTEDTTCYSPTTSASPGESKLAYAWPSPDLLPFDLAALTIDAGEDTADCADDEALDDEPRVSVTIDILSVYKPRPMKKHATHITSLPSTHFEYTKKKFKNGHPPSKPADAACRVENAIPPDLDEIHPQLKGGKTRRRRDKQRELGNDAILTPVDSGCSTRLLADLRVDLQAGSLDEPVLEPLAPAGPTTLSPKEPRLIVEALVVKKLSLNEAYLDFESFTLQ